MLLELGQQLGAQAADADSHRIEHPRLAGGLRRCRRTRNGFLVDREQRAHVQVHGAACGNQGFTLVGQINHGSRATDGELGVGHEIDGDGVGDGPGEGIVGAHVGGSFRDRCFELFLFDHILSYATKNEDATVEDGALVRAREMLPTPALPGQVQRVRLAPSQRRRCRRAPLHRIC